jgi:hypothetical protein
MEAKIKSLKSLSEQSLPLIAQLRELHSICKKQSKKIKPAGDDKKSAIKIPKLDEELLESLEKALSEA